MLLFGLLLVLTRAQLIANPPFAYSANVTTINLGVTINPVELSQISCSLTSFAITSDSVLLGVALSTKNEIRCFAPPGRSGPQLLQLNLSNIGRHILSTTINYYDIPVMTISDGPATYRSTGGNDLNLSPVDCQQLCISGSTLYIRLIDPNPNSNVVVPMQATLVATNDSFVYSGLIPYEVQALENVTTPIAVLVSYDNINYFDSTARFTLRKTSPLRAGFGLFENVMDFGWSYSCNQARVAISERYGRSLETVSITNVRPENDFVALLNSSGPFDFWFYCSGLGYEQNLQLAKQFPNTIVVAGSADGDINAATGTIIPVLSENFNTCWGDLAEARYLAGIAAGGFALQKGLKDIAFVAGLPIPEVVNGINAFALGAKKAHPNATVHLRYINTFFDRYTERACTQQFLAEGIRIIAQHTDSKEPQLATLEAGSWAIGSNSDVERSLFGDGLLTTPYIIWENALLPFVKNAFNDAKVGVARTCGFEGLCVGLAQLSPLISDSVQRLVEEAQDDLSEPGERVFCGEIKDAQGTVRVPSGTCMDKVARANLNWYVDNVNHLPDYVATLPFENRRLIRDPLFGFVCGVMVLMFIITIALTILVVVKRKTPVMKASSWKFLVVILVAVMLSLCAVPLLGLDEGRTSPETLGRVCQVFPWLIMLSMLFSFGSLFGKTWRLFYLFVAKGRSFQRSHFTDLNLLGFVLGCATPGIIICALWSGLDTLTWVRAVETQDQFGNSLVSHGRCTSGGNAAPAALAAYFVLLLLVGNYLAYLTRNLPTSFTESKWIAQILSSVFQCLLLYIPLDLLISESSTEALFLLRALSLMLVNGMLVGFMFGPKLLLMKKHSLKELEDMQSRSMNSYLQETMGSAVTVRSTPTSAQQPTQEL